MILTPEQLGSLARHAQRAMDNDRKRGDSDFPRTKIEAGSMTPFEKELSTEVDADSTLPSYREIVADFATDALLDSVLAYYE